MTYGDYKDRDYQINLEVEKMENLFLKTMNASKEESVKLMLKEININDLNYFHLLLIQGYDLPYIEGSSLNFNLLLYFHLSLLYYMINRGQGLIKNQHT